MQSTVHAAEQEANATMAYFSVASRAIRWTVSAHFLLSDGVGHGGLRYFFFDAGEGFFVEFFLSLLLSHEAIMSSRAKQYSSI
jgi:hypothetical protein